MHCNRGQISIAEHSLPYESLRHADLEPVAPESDPTDYRFGDPEFHAAVDQDGLVGFAEDADAGPYVSLLGVPVSVGYEGPEYHGASFRAR